MSDGYDQNDPDRAGGLISDAQGEFVQQEGGGAFDPHAFRGSSPGRPAPSADDAEERPDAPAASDDRDGPSVNDQHMSSPGSEIDKAR
ncbi:hypothetical protein [Actinoplanes sp. URMC 104]|uniref:hypothetical protein n=1 Tax=Actinoplanes sp. URMC 104 TaxID=3423409 RepID=UPI003F1DB678